MLFCQSWPNFYLLRAFGFGCNGFGYIVTSDGFSRPIFVSHSLESFGSCLSLEGYRSRHKPVVLKLWML